MIYIAYIVIFMVVLNLIVAFWNFRYMINNQLVDTSEKALVSVLVPMRNEESNIGKLIDSLKNQTYINFELIIYDDQSTDKSSEIVRQKSEIYSWIKLLNGLELPSGWTGKNYACYQLSKAAKGKYFLFLDADVRLENDAIKGLLGYLIAKKSQVLTVFPHQSMNTSGERKIVPLMMHILLTLLPLYWVRYSPFSAFAAANGQLFLFESDLYKALQPHKYFKNEKVEDISIARYIKSKKYNLSCLAGIKNVKCNMYCDYDSAFNGFAKFLPDFFGGSILFAAIYWLYTSFAWLIVLFVLNWYSGIILLLIQLSTRMIVAKTSNLNLKNELKYYLSQQVNFILILFSSIDKTIKGTHIWKDRKVG